MHLKSTCTQVSNVVTNGLKSLGVLLALFFEDFVANNRNDNILKISKAKDKLCIKHERLQQTFETFIEKQDDSVLKNAKFALKKQCRNSLIEKQLETSIKVIPMKYDSKEQEDKHHILISSF